MKKVSCFLVILAICLVGCVRGRVIVPPPPPPVVEFGVGEAGPPIGEDVYYDGPFYIGGAPYWYYNGGFFIFEGGFYHFHHRCFGGCDRGFYDRHWRGGHEHHRSEWHKGHGGEHHKSTPHKSTPHKSGGGVHHDHHK